MSQLCIKSKLKNTYNTYMERITTNCYTKSANNIKVKTTKKILDENVKIPIPKTINELYVYNYSINQLKEFSKYYKLKITGTKIELLLRLYAHLYFNANIIKIQSAVRRWMVKLYIKMHGPAAKNRQLCVNTEDLITMDSIDSISFHQFFSYKDEDEFIYGFNICSIYNLIKKTTETKKPLNPYNRNIIHPNIVQKIHSIIKLSKMYNINVQITYDDDSINLPIEKTLELKALSIFQNINSLGNYSDSKWFLELSRTQLIRFLRELCDIWNYRAQIPFDTKKKIIPPLGNPFNQIHLSQINTETNIFIIKKNILDILEKFVNSGTDIDSKTLGSYYVLGALTLVNENAANSLPWLFQSFEYI